MNSLIICTPVLLARYYSGDEFEKSEMGGAYSPYGEGRDAYRILVGKLEGRR
jgi:hypothetical protein